MSAFGFIAGLFGVPVDVVREDHFGHLDFFAPGGHLGLQLSQTTGRLVDGFGHALGQVSTDALGDLNLTDHVGHAVAHAHADLLGTEHWLNPFGVEIGHAHADALGVVHDYNSAGLEFATEHSTHFTPGVMHQLAFDPGDLAAHAPAFDFTAGFGDHFGDALGGVSAFDFGVADHLSSVMDFGIDADTFAAFDPSIFDALDF